MSIQSEMDRIKGNIAEAYSAVEDKGGSVPEEPVSGNLADSIRSIPDGFSSEIYSAEETRVGTYIDGKPLYRRVAIVTAPIENNTVATFNISDWSIDNVASLSGLLERESKPGTFAQLPLLGYSTTNGAFNRIGLYIGSRNKIQIEHFSNMETKSSWLGAKCIVTVLYTKTTDQPVSIPAVLLFPEETLEEMKEAGLGETLF